MEPSSPQASALSMEHHRSIMSILGVNGFQINVIDGLKSNGSDWRTMSGKISSGMDFVPKVAYPDVYPIQARKLNGEEYYELLLLYVYDVLCCSHNPQLIMNVL